MSYSFYSFNLDTHVISSFNHTPQLSLLFNLCFIVTIIHTPQVSRVQPQAGGVLGRIFTHPFIWRARHGTADMRVLGVQRWKNDDQRPPILVSGTIYIFRAPKVLGWKVDFWWWANYILVNTGIIGIGIRYISPPFVSF